MLLHSALLLAQQNVRSVTLACLAVVLVPWSLPTQASGPPDLVLARPIDQSRLQVTTFATGLSFPTSMAELADGSLLVAQSVGSSLWGSTEGSLVRLTDLNGDGIADDSGTVLASGANLPGLVTSIVSFRQACEFPAT